MHGDDIRARAMGRVWAGQGDEVDCADTPVTSAHMYRCMVVDVDLPEAERTVVVA